MTKKIIFFITFLSFFALMAVTLSQADLANAARGGEPKPSSPLTSPKDHGHKPKPSSPLTSPENHGNPHNFEAAISGATRFFNIN